MGGIYGSTKNAATRVAKFGAEISGKLAKVFAPMLDKRLQDQFNNETDPYGKPWDPLAESTIRRKKGDARILRRTNEMQASTYVHAPGGKLVIRYGDKAKYAQDGDPGRGNRPPRHVAPAHGIPKPWNDDLKHAAAIVAADEAKK